MKTLKDQLVADGTETVVEGDALPKRRDRRGTKDAEESPVEETSSGNTGIGFAGLRLWLNGDSTARSIRELRQRLVSQKFSTLL